jgi:hypothetical protein
VRRWILNLAGIAATATATVALVAPAAANAEVTPLSVIGSGTAGSAAGQFAQPTGLAIDSSGTIVVADKYNNRIAEYTPGGAFIRAFGWGVAGGAGLQVCTTTCVVGTNGGGAGELYSPTDVALDSSGLIYVSDTYNNRISVFTQAGTFVRTFGWDVIGGAAPGTGLQVCTTTCQQGTNNQAGAGAINKARAVDIGPDGNVWVADQNNNRIDVFTPAGGFVRTFGWGVQDGTTMALQVCTSGCQAGLPGAKAGQLSQPRNVSLDADTVYVAEGQNHRISEFTPAGAFIRAFGWDVIGGAAPGTGGQVCTAAGTGCQAGTAGAGDGQFASTYAVLSNGAGLVYAADLNNNRINVFTKAGVFVKTFGWGVQDNALSFEVCAFGCQTGTLLPGVTTGLGSGQLKHPEGLAFDCKGGLWVGDQDNFRIQRFGEPGTPACVPPPAAAGPTGRRAAALKKCKKKHSKHKRKKCRKRARKLPV